MCLLHWRTDDATGVLAVVLRGECLDGTRGGDTMEQDGGIERFTWHSDRSAPVVGDVVDLFGRLRRGAHPVKQKSITLLSPLHAPS
jgi:hypothetical protein